MQAQLPALKVRAAACSNAAAARKAEMVDAGPRQLCSFISPPFPHRSAMAKKAAPAKKASKAKKAAPAKKK